MKTILTQAEFKKFSPKVSGECTLMFNLPAITKEDLSDFYDAQGMQGWLLFSKHELQPEDVPVIDPEIHSKSQSKRIYNKLWVLWKKLKESGYEHDFDKFYKEKTENYLVKIQEVINQYN